MLNLLLVYKELHRQILCTWEKDQANFSQKKLSNSNKDYDQFQNRKKGEVSACRLMIWVTYQPVQFSVHILGL